MKLGLQVLAAAIFVSTSAMALDAAQLSQPASQPASSPSTTRAAAEITVDSSKAPELADFAKKVQQVADQEYPKIIAMLPDDGYTPPMKIRIILDPTYSGVAATSGTTIRMSTAYYQVHQDDLGSVVHELAHVVQHYQGRNNPGWLVEGVADWVRFYHYEPQSARPKPNPKTAAYDGSYRITASFLDWLERTNGPGTVVKINSAMRAGKYEEKIFEDLTHKKLEELGRLWKESLEGPATAAGPAQTAPQK